PNHVLQFRFDEAGWNKIISLMKVVANTGVYQDRKPNQIIDLNQKELAAYLGRVRGPGDNALKVAERPRPSGEAARATWTLYDVPPNPAPGPNKNVTVGRVNAKTGEVKYLKVNRADGRAANAHGLTRDKQGNLWFDVDPGRRSLGKLDPKTEKITVYQTPQNMSPLGGAVTLDVDGKGKIWASAPDGVLQFDPEAEKFTEFKSKNYKRANGQANTYGAAGDRDGNGWWAQMGWDTIGKAEVATGTTVEIKLPEKKSEMDRLTPEQLAAYEKVTDLANGNPLPWGQGPRRMGTDKNADVLWVGNSGGATLARINTKTNATTIVPFPDKAMQPYHIDVDSKHNVWGNLWTNDQI